jgi:hypothetical protein
MEFLMLVLGWFVLSIVVMILADRRGRMSVIWFFLSLVISPLLAGLLVLALPNLTEERAAAERAPCPMCAEPIQRTANLCPHCRSTLPPRWDRAPRDVVRRSIQRRSDSSPPSP